MTEPSRRAAVLDAALVELQQWGVERFSIEATAARAALEPGVVRQMWSGETELIIDAMLSFSQKLFEPPDTGSLHGDFTALALSLAEHLNQPVGRRLLRMMVVDSRSHGPDFETRRRFWALRHKTVQVLFQRAAERGELRDGVDPELTIRMLTSPLHTVALFSDQPVTETMCRSLADLVARSVLRS